MHARNWLSTLPWVWFQKRFQFQAACLSSQDMRSQTSQMSYTALPKLALELCVISLVTKSTNFCWNTNPASVIINQTKVATHDGKVS